jgi:hypothetical protein
VVLGGLDFVRRGRRAKREKTRRGSWLSKRPIPLLIKVVVSRCQGSAVLWTGAAIPPICGALKTLIWWRPCKADGSIRSKPIGARVKAGESLCDIEGEKYGAALEAAKAQVEVTKGDLERDKINVEKGSLGRAVLDSRNLAYQNATNGSCHGRSAPTKIVNVRRRSTAFWSAAALKNIKPFHPACSNGPIVARRSS